MSSTKKNRRKPGLVFPRRLFRSIRDDIKSGSRIRRLRRIRHMEALPRDALDLCAEAYEGLDTDRLADYHVHIAGIGKTKPTGAFVNPDSMSPLNPGRYLRFQIFRHAFGVQRNEESDSAFISELLDRVQAYPHPPCHGILAFDRYHRKDGTPNLASTEFYVPNGYVFKLAENYPRLFAPVISVHPYRPDALEALERWHAAGGRIVKWLPNAMGINPADRTIDSYYMKMYSLGLALLSHGGTEKAVDARDEAQSFGNPQLLRRAMEHGVKVIVAHCASAGSLPDLDHPRKKITPCFSLFIRMMDDPHWKGLLFGEISGLTLANRGRIPLQNILERPDIQERLVNGSDYPFPAVRLAMLTRPFVRWGFIDAHTRRLLDAIRAVSPLLFDLVMKRVLKHPETGEKLADSVFHEHSSLPLKAREAPSAK